MFSCKSGTELKSQSLELDSLFKHAEELIWPHENYDSAESIYNTILKLDPKNSAASFGLVDTKLLQKEYRNAIEVIDSLRQHYPERYWYNLYKGRAIERLHSVDSAIYHYKKFVAGAGDTTWYFQAALTAIIENKPFGLEEIDEFNVDDDIRYKNELLYYDGNGWYEMYGHYYDTALFFKTEIPYEKIISHLQESGINPFSIADYDSGVRVFMKNKFLKPSLELGLTPTD